MLKNCSAIFQDAVYVTCLQNREMGQSFPSKLMIVIVVPDCVSVLCVSQLCLLWLLILEL